MPTGAPRPSNTGPSRKWPAEDSCPCVAGASRASTAASTAMAPAMPSAPPRKNKESQPLLSSQTTPAPVVQLPLAQLPFSVHTEPSASQPWPAGCLTNAQLPDAGLSTPGGSRSLPQAQSVRSPSHDSPTGSQRSYSSIGLPPWASRYRLPAATANFSTVCLASGQVTVNSALQLSPSPKWSVGSRWVLPCP